MRAVSVLFSGGLDSTVLLKLLADEGEAALALAFDYGQSMRGELVAARRIAREVGVPLEVIDIRPIAGLFGASAILPGTGVALTDGPDTDPTRAAPFVNNRNMVLIALALSRSLSSGLGGVAYGAHTNGDLGFADTRESFVSAMAAAVGLADFSSPALVAPFAGMEKAEIVRIGARIGAPMALSRTCFRDLPEHCGRCSACLLRRAAFASAGVRDPTAYGS